jgi:predicted GNAT superfamily acetyltransferase
MSNLNDELYLLPELVWFNNLWWNQFRWLERMLVKQFQRGFVVSSWGFADMWECSEHYLYWCLCVSVWYCVHMLDFYTTDM